METNKISSGNRVVSGGGFWHGLVPVVTPVLLISMGYIDPGKWASCIDSGARFGGDLVAFVLAFNFVGILCHYLSARIGVITRKTLAQICSEEYDKLTCFFLGVQAELSVVCLDLTMILGIAHGFNMISGLDLFTCVLLTALNAVLYPIFSTLLDSSKVKFLVICMAGLTFVCYVLGMLISLPESPVSSNGLLSKLSGESAFALMSLLGANVMPHNFYLLSSIVQRYQGPASVLKGVWSHDNVLVMLTISCGIFLVNYVLMNSAANVFYSSGLGLLTFQDSMSLLDQAFRNPVIPFASFVILFLANQITALSWEFCGEGGETMLHDFFNMDLPEWLHRATVRIFAVVPALFCLWHSGADGMYHMLICSQVMMALLLPSSVIPLFRIASSRPIMGLLKISPILEFVIILTFMGMLGLEIIFVVEMIFGESDWVGNLRWSMGNTTSIAYILLLFASCVSLCFMLWLAATPLKSASASVDSQPWNWDAQQVESESYLEREGDVVETRCREDKPLNEQEYLPSPEKSFRSPSDLLTGTYDINLPETIMDTVQEPYVVNTTKETVAEESVPSVESVATDPVPVSSVGSGPSDVPYLVSSRMKTEPTDPVEKTLKIEGGGDSQIEKEDEEGDTWEPDESSKDTPGAGPPVMPEGPGSFRSLSGKSDEGGTGPGSLSRLSGLGRAARRQLAAALDEFWGQLYDFHGQPSQEAKSKKLDLVLGVEAKASQALTRADSVGKEFGMQYQSLGGRVSENPMNMGLYDTPNQQKMQNNIESAYRAQGGSASSLWSNQMQLLDSYVQSSNRSTLDAGERRYQSLRLPPSSDALEYQPATVHGYQFASYLNRMAKDRSDYVNGGQLDSAPQKSPSLVPNNYRESLAFALGQKSTNGFSNSVQPSSIQNLAVQRNSIIQQSNRPGFDPSSASPIENTSTQSNNTKKYHSLPDISGLSVPLRNLYLSNKNRQWDIPNSSLGYGASVGRTTYEPSSYTSTTGSRAVAPLAFDELSPSRVYRDALSFRMTPGSDTGSLWSKQPFEQFGVANKPSSLGGEGPGNRASLMTQEPLTLAEIERKLLQSMRHCIMKLLKLEGCEWLFRANDGLDEDLIDRVATRERFFSEVESQDLKQTVHLGESHYPYPDRKPGASMKGDEVVCSVPHCGEGCVWKVDLIVSFGVWSIHRILELSLMESRPELWGKYTYVLNRLQGVIDLAFFKPRTPMSPCFCLQIPVSYQMRSSPPVSNGMLPPTARPARGKLTTAAMLLEIIKDVEIAISCRKGRSGTAAGDVAFPKGKENLASVLKRYKRRLSNKSVGTTHEARKLQSSTSYGS